MPGRDYCLVTIEAKLGAAISDADVRHLHWLREKIGKTLANAIVVSTRAYAYQGADGSGVLPAALLGP